MTTEHIYEQLKAAGITEVDVGYKKFKLVFKRSLTYNGNKCHGLTDWDRSEISLVLTQPDADSRETLVHELLHVVLDLVGLGGHETTGIVTRRTNEELVTLISRGLVLLMNLNPRLFSIIDARTPPRPQPPADPATLQV